MEGEREMDTGWKEGIDGVLSFPYLMDLGGGGNYLEGFGKDKTQFPQIGEFRRWYKLLLILIRFYN